MTNQTDNQCEEDVQLPFTGDPQNNVFDRIRILCTDTDNNDIMVPQEIIEFMYQEAGQNETLAASKALTFLMMQIAKQGDEQVGGVTQKNSERIKNMRLVLDNLKADLLKNGIGSAYAGGISRADVQLRRYNPDSPRKGVQFGDATRLDGGSQFGACGVAGSFHLHEAPFDIPAGCILVPL